MKKMTSPKIRPTAPTNIGITVRFTRSTERTFPSVHPAVATIQEEIGDMFRPIPVASYIARHMMTG